MGFFDGAIGQQDGGGMMGGLPASWQYQNPETLTPEQRKLMALVDTQNPANAGFNPPADAPGAFPAGGAAPIAGANSPFGMLSQPLQAPAPAPFPQGGDPMAGTGSGNVAGLPMPTPPISSDNSAPVVAQAPAAASPLVAPPMPTFGAGASPIFATAPGSTPGNPALPSAAPMVKPPVVAADDGEEDPPAANALASPLKVGNVQMPRIGPAAAFTPDPAALPANAQPTQGVGAPGTDAAPSIGDKLMAGYQNLHHGGGLIGSIVAAVTGKRNDPTGVATQQQAQIANQTARALVNKGISQDLAIAAVQPGNSELLKSLLTQTFAPKTVTSIGEGYVSDKDGNVRRAYVPEQKDNFSIVQTGENGLGGKTYSKINKATGEMTPIGNAGNEMRGLGDMSKTGAEYLATIPKDSQHIVKGLVDGTIQPPSSFAASKPYWQNMVAAAKQLDPTFDENNWAGRHKMSVDLASSGNSSMGGILSNGESSFKHLAEYTASAADLGNASHNYVGGGMIAHAQNYIGNTTGGSDTQGKIKALKDNLGHYGQESTKFYAGTGGGVEERMHALKEMDPTTTSGEEAAAYAEKEKGLMTDRLFSKLQEIKNVYGEEQGNRIIAKHMPDIEKHMALIDKNIARLRGQAAPETDKPAPVQALKVGESTKINGVSIKKVGN